MNVKVRVRLEVGWGNVASERCSGEEVKGLVEAVLFFLDILRCSNFWPQNFKFNKLIAQLDICLCIAPRDQML